MKIKCEDDFQREILKDKWYDAHAVQTESTKINPGVFDLNIGWSNQDHWVELKWKYMNKKPNIRPAQARFARDRLKTNDSMWILTGSNERVILNHASDINWMKTNIFTLWEDRCTFSMPLIEFMDGPLIHLAGAFGHRRSLN